MALKSLILRNSLLALLNQKKQMAISRIPKFSFRPIHTNVPIVNRHHVWTTPHLLNMMSSQAATPNNPPQDSTPTTKTGPAKSKKTPVANNEEENQTVSNGSHVTNENGCGEMGTDQTVQNECSLEVNEKAEGNNGSDDPRPPKRGKPLNDQTCEVIGEINGSSFRVEDLDTSGGQLESHPTTDQIETDKSLKLHPREKKLIPSGGPERGNNLNPGLHVLKAKPVLFQGLVKNSTNSLQSNYGNKE